MWSLHATVLELSSSCIHFRNHLLLPYKVKAGFVFVGRGEKFVQGFGGKARSKETARKTKA
jgi:hypothetical protein